MKKPAACCTIKAGGRFCLEAAANSGTMHVGSSMRRRRSGGCVRAQWYDTSCGVILESRGEYSGKCVFTAPNKNGDYILLLRAK